MVKLEVTVFKMTLVNFAIILLFVENPDAKTSQRKAIDLK